MSQTNAQHTLSMQKMHRSRPHLRPTTVILMYTSFHQLPTTPFTTRRGAVTLALDEDIGRTLAYKRHATDTRVIIEQYDADEVTLDEDNILAEHHADGDIHPEMWAWLPYYIAPTVVSEAQCPVELHHNRKSN